MVQSSIQVEKRPLKDFPQTFRREKVEDRLERVETEHIIPQLLNLGGNYGKNTI